MKSSSAALLVCALIAGCEQNEVLESVDARAGKLEVNVTEVPFDAADAESRAAYNGKSTTFEKGDKVGLYIVENGSSIIRKNQAIEFNGTDWSENEVYYYSNADYIAYYPYDEDMGGMMSADDIKEYFADKYSENQSTEVAYRNCDLMIAEVKAADLQEGGALNLNLSHTMSLIEFSIPTYSYKTSEEDGAYTYGVPLAGLKIMVGDTEYTPYNIATGVYRCIVSPSEEGYSIAGEFTDAKANKPVTFGKDGVTVAENGYRRYNVTYEGAPSGEPTVRAIAVGDFYYSNGNIVPNDFPTIPVEGCLGVVFSTTANSETALDGTTCTNGYVLSLANASGAEAGSANTWTYNLWDSAPADLGDLGLTETANASVSTLVNDNDGLKYTKILIGENITSTGVDKMKHALASFGAEGNKTQAYAAPEFTSGWFVPSVGQVVSLIRNLGGKSDFDGDKVTDASIYFNIDAVLAKVGSSLDTGAAGANGKIWTSNTGITNGGAKGGFLLELRGTGVSDAGKCEIWASGGTANGDKSLVRPILAF